MWSGRREIRRRCNGRAAIPPVTQARMGGWWQDPDVLAAGAREVAAYLTDLHAVGRRFEDKGYDPGPVDGIWGPRTAAAISEYQRKEKMTVTNRLDTETLAKLEVAPKKPQSP